MTGASAGVHPHICKCVLPRRPPGRPPKATGGREKLCRIFRQIMNRMGEALTEDITRLFLVQRRRACLQKSSHCCMRCQHECSQGLTWCRTR